MDAAVVIVGAGPAGALLAYLLSSRGIDTTLIERHSDFAREFRGEILMPSGIRALSDSGVTLDDIATSTPETVEAFLNGKRFAAVSTRTLGEFRPTAVSQPELLEALVGRAQASGHFELLRGTTVRGISQDDSGQHALRLKQAGSDAETTLQARFVIGADGRGSIVRRRRAPAVLRRSTPLDVVWFKLPYPAAWPEARARVELGKGHLTIAARSPEGLLQVAWVIVKGSFGELKSRSTDDWAEEMSHHTDPELASHLLRYRDQITRPFLLDAIADRVRGWAAPGSLLIGDAAHTMSPVGGQGLNLALRDAIVAANELVPVLRRAPALGKGADLDVAASRVEALRAPEIDLIQRLAALPPRLVMGRSPLHRLGRRALAAVAGSRVAQFLPATIPSYFLNGVTRVELTV